MTEQIRRGFRPLGDEPFWGPASPRRTGRDSGRRAKFLPLWGARRQRRLSETLRHTTRGLLPSLNISLQYAGTVALPQLPGWSHPKVSRIGDPLIGVLGKALAESTARQTLSFDVLGLNLAVHLAPPPQTVNFGGLTHPGRLGHALRAALVSLPPRRAYPVDLSLELDRTVGNLSRDYIPRSGPRRRVIWRISSRLGSYSVPGLRHRTIRRGLLKWFERQGVKPIRTEQPQGVFSRERRIQ